MRLLATVALAGLVLALTNPAIAQVTAVTRGGVAVAHDGDLELFSANGRQRIWKAEGVRYPGTMATGDQRLALLDPISGAIRIVELSTGDSSLLQTGDTPVSAVFAGEDLFVVLRDGRKLERIARDGTRSSLGTGAFPELIRLSGGKLYLYSRGDGLLQEIQPQTLRVTRSIVVAPFASDFEIDGRFAYFLYPAEAKLRAMRLDAFRPAGETKVGGAPVDLAISNRRSALTAGQLLVADPSSKRVWVMEGSQSAAAAFGRGFLRGLLGLGLFGGRESAFRTGIDRVDAVGATRLAYDSSTGTLYSFNGKENRAIAAGIAPRAFAASEGTLYYWNGMLVAQKLNR